MFKNRIEAAILLSEKLTKFKNDDCVILAIPRGGVPIGFVLSKELNLPLDIILSKKIGHPSNKEFAIGSVTLQGFTVESTYKERHATYIQKEIPRLQEELLEKQKTLLGNKHKVEIKNKTVIIVDDGIATGNTVLASIHALRKRKPRKIIVAVPVSPADTADKLSKIADEFICLYIPSHFQGVGQFYRNFKQVEDDEVKDLLSRIKGDTVH
jgi:putative phosphoribosyl transferase